MGASTDKKLVKPFTTTPTTQTIQQRPKRKRKEHTIQIRPGNGKRIRRKENGNNPPVPEHADELERLAPLPEAPLGLGKALRGADETGETDEAVGCCAGDTGCGDERCECHIGGEERAGDQGCYGPDDDHGVAGLAVVDFRDP
ncbi:unnamed protein product [Aspergillus oryzae var. brunneus]|uniref:Unnamed protein product n=2 Tax=Aspergillus oryzae TaxID=5062 RepID=A0AAN4YIW3_ASPOZ|nr:unnamed protein product [Aspergillus oryzae]GMG29680.1 unnamed protein product [Aspergillus oryzae]GMG46577.1 unnamed protein product [Aspergillus oryzae var. brunneus]